MLFLHLSYVDFRLAQKKGPGLIGVFLFYLTKLLTVES